jgi:predicted transcriptional regulator
MTYKRSSEAARRKRQRQYQRLRPQIAALYNELFQRFPQTFFRVPEQVHPLQIGIFAELCARLGAPRKVVHYVMRRYTRQQAYLQALAAGKPRLDLAGQAVETVSDSHRAQAQARLNQKPTRRRAPRLTTAEHPAQEATPPATAPQASAAATLSALKAQEAYEAIPAASAVGTPPMNWCKSITPETITCLECGQTFKQLSSRHLGLHGLDTRSYRTKYGIPRTQPLAARATTDRRRQLVREIRPWEKRPEYRKGQA